MCVAANHGAQASRLASNQNANGCRVPIGRTNAAKDGRARKLMEISSIPSSGECRCRIVMSKPGRCAVARVVSTSPRSVARFAAANGVSDLGSWGKHQCSAPSRFADHKPSQRTSRRCARCHPRYAARAAWQRRRVGRFLRRSACCCCLRAGRQAQKHAVVAAMSQVFCDPKWAWRASFVHLPCAAEATPTPNSDCMSLPQTRRLTLDVTSRVARIGRAEPHTWRASREAS
jgi:hypothetical protein